MGPVVLAAWLVVVVMVSRLELQTNPSKGSHVMVMAKISPMVCLQL